MNYIKINDQKFPVIDDILDLREKNIKKITEINGLNKLKDLKTLDLRQNDISKIEGLENLENLKELILGGNNIVKIQGLNNLRNLENLELWNNKITEIANLGCLISLKELKLEYNHITKIQRLDNLIHLKNLSLWHNKIMEIEGLENLTDLKCLDLSDNEEISELKGLGNLINLETLKMPRTRISPKLIEILGGLNENNRRVNDPKKWIAYCRDEYINYNGDIIFPGHWHEYDGLGLSMLEMNIISIKSLKNLAKIKNLKALHLHHNDIVNIEGLEDLTELEYLCLSHNKIIEIKGLETLRNLKILELNDNSIKKIENLESLGNLLHLKLHHNQINECAGLNKLKNLKYLDVSHNEIIKIQGLSELSQLIKLNLESNSINQISGLNSLKNLEYLILNSNKIEKIEGLEELLQLNELSLSDNSITKITGLNQNVKIYTLDLNDNNISDLNGLKDTLGLRTLNLENNKSIEKFVGSIRSISNDETFAKNCIGYCFLRELIKILEEKEINIILFEEQEGNYDFLLRFKYNDIKKLTNLITSEYFEFQVGRNHFVTSIFKPEYIAKKIDERLEKMEIGEEQKYSLITQKLKLKSEECTEKLLEYIEEQELYTIPFSCKSKTIIKRKGSSLKQLIYDIFIPDKNKVDIDSTKSFNSFSKPHTRILKFIQKQISNEFIVDITHNIRDEASVDLFLREINKNWKIGIAVEVTSDLTESGVKNRKETFPKTILSKITDAKRNYNLDLLVFLFCIDITNKGYNETLNITKGKLEQIENEKFMYISPEYLVGFFEELFNELEKIR